jgi:PAS domain S-box-containing protein
MQSMLIWIKQFLAPPVFEDEDKTRVAGLLNIILLATIAINVVYSPILVVILPNPTPSLVVDNILLLLEIGLLVLMRRGYVQAASILLSFIVWVYITFVLYFFGGVRSPVLNGYIILVLIAGLLLGGQGALGFAGLSVMSSLALLFAELSGILPLSFVALTPAYLWSGLFMVLIVTAVLLYLATRSIDDALERTRRSEARARKAQAQLVDAIESLTEAFVLYDADDRLVLCNSKCSEFYDLSADLLVPGARFEDHIRASAYRGQIAEAIGREEAWVQERVKQHQNPQGVYLQQLSNGRWLQISERKTGEGGIVGVRTDITERVRAEEALRRSEERFRSLIENALDIITVLDSDGAIRYESPSIERVLGYKPRELVGHNVFEFVHPGDLPDVMKTFTERSQIAGPAPPIEVRFQHKDGSWRILEVIGSNLLDDPVMAGIVVNSRDITERRQLEERLRQSQKMEAIGRLAGGVAHDFNNILTVIRGYSELLLRHHLDEHDPERKDIEHIKKAGERATSLTRQLLAFSRQQILQPSVFNLNAVVADLSEMLRRLIGEDIDLVILLDKDLGQVKADPGQIEQVILNLAINARDAMPQGGKLSIETANVNPDQDYGRRHIEMELGPYVMLVVSDTGIGMDAKTRSHLFEPFFTTKEQGKGTGLGLATVHGIINQSGGHIWVYSEPEQGTIFKIYLPRTDEAVESGDLDQVPAQSLRGSETIMLVEDEDMVRELARHVLTENGYRVLAAQHGEEALQVCERHKGPIHLLLTDVIMPYGLNGRELAERLALLCPEIRVIYMSGYTDNAIVHHRVLDPGVNFLQKPFVTDTLVAKVRQVLDTPQSKMGSDPKNGLEF